MMHVVFKMPIFPITCKSLYAWSSLFCWKEEENNFDILNYRNSQKDKTQNVIRRIHIWKPAFFQETNIYSSRNIWKRNEVYSRLTIKNNGTTSWTSLCCLFCDFEYISLFFYCFYCWLWTGKCLLGWFMHCK